MNRTHEEMAFELGKQAWSKRTWLENPPKNWPATDIERKQIELAVLEQAERMFAKAAARDKGEAA